MARRAQVILLVEDEAELRYVFRTALVFDGFNVHEARDGYEAVRWLEQGTADLIVLDLRLPLIDGLAVLGELEYKEQVPVVVVTASDEDVSQFDVEDVLRKPVTTDTLVDTVRRCLGVRH
jgi:two-component system response regulator HydG